MPSDCRSRYRRNFLLQALLLPLTLLACAAGVSNQPEPAAAAAASPIATMSSVDLGNGQRLFRVHCARCHGMQGNGGEGPSLRRAQLKHASDDESLFTVINEGIRGTGMPGTWAPNDDELWQIAGYVRSLGALPKQAMPGDPGAGALVYARSGCATCHISNGQGRGVGPELTEVGLRRNAEYLRRSLTNPDADAPMSSNQITGHINAFLTVRVVAADGEYEGLRIAEDDFSVQMRDISGAIRSFDKSKLLRYEKAFGHSLMPGYETTLSTTDADDLVSYLMNLKGTQ